MTTINKYQKEIRDLFFISVDIDIDEWECYSNDYEIHTSKKIKIVKML